MTAVLHLHMKVLPNQLFLAKKSLYFEQRLLGMLKKNMDTFSTFKNMQQYINSTCL